MVTKIRIANIAAIVSDLDPDDFADHEIADCLQTDADHQHGMADRIVEQRLDEHGIHEIHAHHDDGWHTHEQEHGETSLRGVDAHLPQDFEPLADDVGEVVEDLGEIATRFALQHDGRHEEFHVDQGNAIGKIPQSLTNRQTEFLLLEKLAELTRHRLRDLVGDHFKGGGESMPRADGAGESIDGFRKKFLEFVEALGALEICVSIRHKTAQKESNPRKYQNLIGGKVNDEGCKASTA